MSRKVLKTDRFGSSRYQSSPHVSNSDQMGVAMDPDHFGYLANFFLPLFSIMKVYGMNITLVAGTSTRHTRQTPQMLYHLRLSLLMLIYAPAIALTIYRKTLLIHYVLTDCDPKHCPVHVHFLIVFALGHVALFYTIHHQDMVAMIAYKVIEATAKLLKDCPASVACRFRLQFRRYSILLFTGCFVHITTLVVCVLRLSFIKLSSLHSRNEYSMSLMTDMPGYRIHFVLAYITEAYTFWAGCLAMTVNAIFTLFCILVEMNFKTVSVALERSGRRANSDYKNLRRAKKLHWGLCALVKDMETCGSFLAFWYYYGAVIGITCLFRSLPDVSLNDNA